MAEPPLRIGLVSTQYPPAVGGGIGRFTADLARGFADGGHEVHVFSAQGRRATFGFEDGIWVHRFPEVPFVPEDLAGEAALLDLSRIGSVYREVAHAQRHRPFDVVSSPIWLAEGLLVAMDPRFVSVLSLQTTTRTLTEFDGYWRSNARSPALVALERRAVDVHRHTHAFSHASLARVTEEYGPPRSAAVIPLGVADHSPRFRRRRDRDGGVRILVAGRLEIRKGGDLLPEVMDLVLRRCPAAEFVLVGEAVRVVELGGRTVPDAVHARLAAAPEVLRRISFAGVVPDDELYQHYADADIFLFPTRYESFGLPVVEAMAFGLPIVASRVGALREVVADGESGVLVDAADVPALVDALRGLIEDGDRRRRLGAASRARYRESFSLAVSVPRTLAAYRAMAADGGPPAAVSVDTGALARRFAAVIEEVTACRGDAALGAARRLVGDATEHERYAEAVRRMWALGDRRFVAQLHELLHGERPSGRALKAALQALRRAGSRLAAVRAAARAPAARRAGTPHDWLHRLAELGLSERNAGTPYERHVRRHVRGALAAVARGARELWSATPSGRRRAIMARVKELRSRRATHVRSRQRRRRTAIVWLTHFLDAEGMAAVGRLGSEAAALGTVVCAYHTPAGRRGRIPGVPTVALGDADLAAALPGRFAAMVQRRAPLNDVLDLVHFAAIRRLPDFDHWWFVEYDTDFSADWESFFRAFAECDADLLGTTIYPRTVDPRWFFWPDFEAPPSVPPGAAARGFFPVVRLSRRFVETYTADVADGWHGHFESLYPTIALVRGLVVEDIGGTGPFVPPSRRGLFYRNSYRDLRLYPGTFRFQPPVSTHYFAPTNRDLAEPERLWHPIKTHGYREHARAARRGDPGDWRRRSRS